MKQNIIYATVLAAVMFASCTKDETSMPAGIEVERELLINVSTEGDQTKVTSALNGSSVDFKWESTDLLGGYVDNSESLVSFETVNFEGDGTSAEFKGIITDGAQTIRLVYPYVSTATSGLYPIDLSAQSDTFAGSFESVSAKTYLVSPEVIDISGVTEISSLAMDHLVGSMQFKFKFPAGFVTTNLTGLKISGLPTAATADLTKASSASDILSDNTTSSTITISTGGVEVVANTEYSLEASIIPFTLAEGETLSFEAVLESGLVYKGESNAAAAGGVTFAAGKRHTISTVTLAADAVCTLSGIAATADETVVITFNQALNAPASADCGLSMTRNGSAATITAVALDPNASNKLVVTIDGGAWNGDEILVSYSGTGLTTSGGAEVPTFTDESTVPYIVNLISDGDMENGVALIGSRTTATWGLTDPQYTSVGTETDGNKYMSVSLIGVDDVTPIYFQSAVNYNLSYDVEYMYEYRYYVETADADAADPYNYIQPYVEDKSTYAAFVRNYLPVTVASSGWGSYAGTFTATSSTGATEFEGVLYIQKVSNEVSVRFDDFKLYEYKKHE